MPIQSPVRLLFSTLLCWSLCALPAVAVRGDVFHFKDGRVVSGVAKPLPNETVNKLSVRAWAVEIETGVYLRVLESELANNGYEPLSVERSQYEQNVGDMEQTVEKHAALAGECSKLGLTDLARAHFLRILDLDPENRPARIATGYSQDNNGRWVKKEVVMGEQRGKVFVKGKWKFPETLIVEDAKEEARRNVGLASRDLHRWHSTVLSARGARVNDALQNIAQVNDPLTTGTLAEFLLDAKKPAPLELKLLYVKLLSQFENFDAARALATASVLDPHAQVRNASLTAIRHYGREVAIPLYIGYLRNKNNSVVNIAAEALGDLRAETAFLPLVDALITKHIQENNSAGINASPTSGSFSMGGPSSTELDVPNQSVASTLQGLTGQSFGLDKAAWLAWYASVHAPPARDLRRDLQNH